MPDSFQLWPALDLLGGRVVRLRQGDFDDVTTFDEAPEALVARAAAFGDGLHVVDLDGARSGATVNEALVRRIVRASPVPVQLGGGLRTLDAVARAVELGVARVVVGSKAVEDPGFVGRLVQAFGPDAVAVGADLRGGRLATHGWTETSEQAVDDFFATMTGLGVETFVVTDIATDGMLAGPNVALIKRVAGAFSAVRVLASGGVASTDDLDALRGVGAGGAVLGRAWLGGTLSTDALRTYAETV